MHVDVISDLKTFSELKTNWTEVYEADPEAHFFLSWSWLSNWFKEIKSDWFVLAVKTSAEDSRYVAFFPLQRRTELKKDGTIVNEIRMGGAEFADYTGFVITPAYQDEALRAFANHIKHMNWASLHLTNFRVSERRLRFFQKAFAQTRFVTRRFTRTIEDGKIDCCLYPYVDLPADWDKYLCELVSANTRQKARRFLKKIDESDEFRITHADADTFPRDLDILLKFWEQKWGAKKGEKLANILFVNRVMLTRSFAEGVVIMPVLWKGDRPLGAHAILTDPVKKSLQFLIGSRDETFSSPPPGFTLHAHAIRWAIQNGYTTYDFLQGNEPYKYMFARKDRHVPSIAVTTRSGRNLGEILDRGCLSSALDKVVELHKKGKLAAAERGYRQIVDTDPEFAPALYVLAQLLATRGNHIEAKKYFKTYLAILPRAHAAWLKLGKTLEALSDIDGAADSYQKVLTLEPSNHEARGLLLKLRGPGNGPRTHTEELAKQLSA